MPMVMTIYTNEAGEVFVKVDDVVAWLKNGIERVKGKPEEEVLHQVVDNLLEMKANTPLP